MSSIDSKDIRNQVENSTNKSKISSSKEEKINDNEVPIQVDDKKDTKYDFLFIFCLLLFIIAFGCIGISVFFIWISYTILNSWGYVNEGDIKDFGLIGLWAISYNIIRIIFLSYFIIRKIISNDYSKKTKKKYFIRLIINIIILFIVFLLINIPNWIDTIGKMYFIIFILILIVGLIKNVKGMKIKD